MKTKLQLAIEKCNGKSREFTDGYIDAVFGNDFRPGADYGSNFVQFDNGSLRWREYTDGFDTFRGEQQSGD